MNEMLGLKRYRDRVGPYLQNKDTLILDKRISSDTKEQCNKDEANTHHTQSSIHYKTTATKFIVYTAKNKGIVYINTKKIHYFKVFSPISVDIISYQQVGYARVKTTRTVPEVIEIRSTEGMIV